MGLELTTPKSRVARSSKGARRAPLVAARFKRSLAAVAAMLGAAVQVFPTAPWGYTRSLASCLFRPQCFSAMLRSQRWMHSHSWGATGYSSMEPPGASPIWLRPLIPTSQRPPSGMCWGHFSQILLSERAELLQRSYFARFVLSISETTTRFWGSLSYLVHRCSGRGELLTRRQPATG